MIKKIILLVVCMMMMGCSSVSVEKESKDTGLPTKQTYDSIENNGVRVFYSEGYMEKAQLHLERLEAMKNFYNEKVSFDMGFDVYVFDKEDHEKEIEGAVPYGMPFTVPTEETKGSPWIFMPATDDGVVTQSVIGFVNDLKPETLDYFEKAGYSNEDGIKTYTDLILLHEIAHNVAFSMEIKNLGHWFDETIANYIVLAYLEEKDSDLAAIWNGNAYIAYLNGDSPSQTSLEAFNSNYGKMDPANYDWYQKEFAKKNIEIYDELGFDFLLKVKEKLAGKTIEDSDKLVEELNEITKVFSKW